ncbi:MAG: NAD(+) diphosphatase [Chitinophagales bacterium]
MIQDIFPHQFSNEYVDKSPNNDSVVLLFHGNKLLVKTINNELHYPRYSDFKAVDVKYIYLFKINEMEFFLAQTEKEITISDYHFESLSILRKATPKYLAFAGISAYHLARWYQDNRLCGRCGNKLEHASTERMLFCNNCKNSIYPKIAPVVIVAVTDGDRLLMTKYANRDYKKYALVAGFIEFGESAEETIKREVREEVGLGVKNITYYKSQPWGFSESLLLGYFAELGSDTAITMDTNELSEAVWVHRDEIEVEDDRLSLTNEMIRQFKNRKAQE